MRTVVLTAIKPEIPKCLRNQHPGTWQRYGRNSICVMTSGIGQKKARKAMQSICDNLRAERIVCMGICGAALPELQVGDIVVANRVVYKSNKIDLAAHNIEAVACLEQGGSRHTVGGFETFDRPVTSRQMIS